MSRPLRIQFPGALYHVTSRGNQKAAIFVDDHDRKRRLDWLSRTAAMYGLRLHAFVLMDNHDHLFVETPQPNLSAAMHYYNSSYTGYFNRRHGRAGHLLQGRYFAVLIENEGHYLEVSRYIHLNPVRAKLVKHPREWPWSSYIGYERGSRVIPWVTYSRVLAEFGSEERAARRAYCAFVTAGMERPPPSPLTRALHGVILGSETFALKVRKLLTGRKEDPGLPVLREMRLRPPIDRILKVVREVSGSAPAAWQPGRRDKEMSRALAAYVARTQYGYSATAIAPLLGYSGHSSVHFAIHRLSVRSPQISRVLRNIEAKLAY